MPAFSDVLGNYDQVVRTLSIKEDVAQIHDMLEEIRMLLTLM